MRDIPTELLCLISGARKKIRLRIRYKYSSNQHIFTESVRDEWSLPGNWTYIGKWEAFVDWIQESSAWILHIPA